MVEGGKLETLSPKELGKHLREVRRRKGLSLSEVARGAGLTRRELNAYEKGRSPIPDHDLFVLAGSLGIDVAELRVPTTATELGAAHEVGNALDPANGPAEPIDVFQELAALPDPEPLPALHAAGHDIFGRMADPGTPWGLTDEAPGASPFAEWPAFGAENEDDAFDALRGASTVSPWDALRGTDARSIDRADIWETANVAASASAQWFDDVSSVAAVDTAPEASVSHIFDPRGAGAPADAPSSWAHEADAVGVAESAWDLPEAVVAWETASEPELETGIELETAAMTIAKPWTTDANSEVVETVDHATHPMYQAPYHDDVDDEAASEPETDGAKVFQAFGPIAPAAPVEMPAESEFVIEGDGEQPLINWHPPLDDAPIAPLAPVVLDPERERFDVAGSEWVLGNAEPLVEVRSTGSLVMRRADERWALADVTASSNFTVEVNVDLRSGPGFGVLFYADLDDEGRMSGYSFDVDPVYEGGGYLVREWRANRELWNPIGQVAAPPRAALHGLLELRLTVDDGRLVAAVNGDVVLAIDNLQQASIARGRVGASGNRVGVQAWSSTDLVVDELRIATR